MSTVQVELPSTLTAEWIEGPWDFEREVYRDASIVLFFGEHSIGQIPIPDGFSKTVPAAQAAIDCIVAEFLREKLFGIERKGI